MGSASGTSGANTLTSVGGVGYEPFLLDVSFVENATALGDSASYTLNLLKCQLIGTISEGDPNQIAISGTSLGGISVS